MSDVFFIGVAVGALVAPVLTGYLAERNAWNGGICRACGSRLECFDMDSQGGRMYCCRNHSKTLYGPTISWPIDGPRGER